MGANRLTTKNKAPRKRGLLRFSDVRDDLGYQLECAFFL
jgi:hypothetical protein